jgi:hypothetical protein
MLVYQRVSSEHAHAFAQSWAQQAKTLPFGIVWLVFLPRFQKCIRLEWNFLHQLIKDTLGCHRHPHLSAAPETCQDSSWIHFVIRRASVKQKRTSGVEQHIDGTLHNYCINLQIGCFCSHLWQIRNSSLKWGVSLIECARSHRVRHRRVVHWSLFLFAWIVVELVRHRRFTQAAARGVARSVC